MCGESVFDIGFVAFNIMQKINLHDEVSSALSFPLVERGIEWGVDGRE